MRTCLSQTRVSVCPDSFRPAATLVIVQVGAKQEAMFAMEAQLIEEGELLSGGEMVARALEDEGV